MAAELTGVGFKITPSGKWQQDVLLGGAQWQWTVTALKGHKHQLRLAAYVLVPDADKQKPQLLKTLDVPLAVKVPLMERVDDGMIDSAAWLQHGANWLKALLAFLLAAAGVIAFFKRKRRRKTAPSGV